MSSFKELPPKQLKVLEKRLSPPEVRKQIVTSLIQLEDGIENGSELDIYRGAVEFATAYLFGEEALGTIDWTKPPKLENPEKRHLAILDKLSGALEEKDNASATQIIKGIAPIGSTSKGSAEMVCNPELLAIFPTIIILQPLFEQQKLKEKELIKTSVFVKNITGSYRNGDRLKILDSLVGLQNLVEPHLRQLDQKK